MQFNLSSLTDIAGLENFDHTGDHTGIATRSIRFSNGVLTSLDFLARLHYNESSKVLTVSTTAPVAIGTGFLSLTEFKLEIKVKDVAGIFNLDNVQSCTGVVGLSNNILAGDLSFVLSYTTTAAAGNAFSLSLSSFDLPGTGLTIRSATFKTVNNNDYSLEGSADYNIGNSVAAGLFGTAPSSVSGSIKINIVKTGTGFSLNKFDFVFKYNDQPLSLLSNADFILSYSKNGSDWNVKVNASVTNNWNETMQWLQRQTILSESINNIPQTTINLEFFYKQSASSAAITLKLVPDNGDWGGLPISAKGTSLEAKGTISRSGLTNWSLSGETTLTTKAPASNLVPLIDSQFSITVEDNKLLFKLTSGMPVLNIPSPLLRGGLLCLLNSPVYTLLFPTKSQ